MDTTRRPAPSSSSPAASRGGAFSSIRNAARTWRANGTNLVAQQVAQSGLGRMGVIKNAGGVAGGVFGVYSGIRNIVDGARNGDARQVTGGVLSTGKSVLSTARAGLATAAAIESGRNFRAVHQAATRAIGDGSKVSRGIARAAAEAVHLGKDLSKVDVLGQAARSTGFLGNVGTALRSGAANLLGKLPGSLGSGATNLLGRLPGNLGAGLAAGINRGLGAGAATAARLNNSIVRSGAQALGGNARGVARALDAAQTATQAASTAARGAGTAGRLAARFTPGLNVGMAVMDVGIAIKTITDPNASLTSKITSGVTALGSVMAATNIPGVAQAGALISVGATAVGAVVENFDAIKEGVGKAASAVADGAKKVGSAIADGAKKIFSGW